MNAPLARRPREYGVGSFRFDRDQAITLNRLLIGLIAGTLSGRGASVLSIVSKLYAQRGAQFSTPTMKTDEIVDPLIALTLGNILAISAHLDESYDNIGITGSWNSQSCGTDYSLNSPRISYATLSQVRGGIDGYLIGQLMNKLQASKRSKLKLSQILRFYYHPIGARSMAIGYCLRPQSSIDENAIRQNALNIIRIIEASKDSTVEDREFEFALQKVNPGFDNAISRARAIPPEDNEWCSINDVSSGMGREQVA